MARIKSSTKEVFVRKCTVSGKPYGELMILKSKRPMVGKGLITEMDVPLCRELLWKLEGISLPVSIKTMDNLLNRSQKIVIHKMDKFYNKSILSLIPFDERGHDFNYIKFYDYDKRSIFIVFDSIKKIRSMNENCIKVSIIGVFYERKA